MLLSVMPEPQTGIEVGVDKGELSEYLLKTFPKLQLVLVDPWHEHKPRSHFRRRGSNKEMGSRTQEEWDVVFAEVKDRLSLFADRIRVVRATSLEASEVVEGSFDFTYIDACHTHFHVKQDIECWMPKTTKLIFGHDYSRNYPGVKRAVNEAFGNDLILNEKHRLWGHVIHG